jgi:hypothetical protein
VARRRMQATAVLLLPANDACWCWAGAVETWRASCTRGKRSRAQHAHVLLHSIIDRSDVADACAQQGPEALALYQRIAEGCHQDAHPHGPRPVLAFQSVSEPRLSGWTTKYLGTLRGLSLTDLNDYRSSTSARYVRDSPCACALCQSTAVYLLAAETAGAKEETYNEPVNTTILFARHNSAAYNCLPWSKSPSSRSSLYVSPRM